MLQCVVFFIQERKSTMNKQKSTFFFLIFLMTAFYLIYVIVHSCLNSIDFFRSELKNRKIEEKIIEKL